MESLLEDIRSGVDRKFVAECRGLIVDTAKNLKSNDKTFNIETLETHIPELVKVMEQYIDLTHEVEASEKAYLAVIEKVRAIEEGDDEEFIEEDDIIDELDTLTDQEKLSLVDKEKDAIDELKAIIRPEEREAPPDTNNAQRLKDPISKLDIRVPVQSSKCKHVYEKETIENYLETSKKCPQAGCTNKRMTKKELVPFNPQESSPIIIS